VKKLFLASILSLVLLTGCGKKEVITCTQSQTMMGVKIEAVMKIELEGNHFQNIDMQVDAILPETYLSKKDVFVKSFEKSYADYEKKYGVKPNISETDEGVRVTANMTAEQAVKFSGSANTKATRKEVIDTFSKQGYTCE